jgi:hypothetical protein
MLLALGFKNIERLYLHNNKLHGNILLEMANMPTISESLFVSYHAVMHTAQCLILPAAFECLK